MNLYRIFSVNSIANTTIAITWIYHGLIPKILHMETGELDMLKASGMFSGYPENAVIIIGIAEIIFGIAFLIWGRFRILHFLNILGLLGLGTAAFIIQSGVYLEPFNPATTSLGAIALSCIVLISGKKEIEENKLS